MDVLHVKELYTGEYTSSTIGDAAGYISVKDEIGSTRKVLVR